MAGRTIPPNLSKLLVFKEDNDNYLAYRLGRWNIYLDTLRYVSRDVSIARVLSESTDDVSNYLNSEDQLEILKIFKTCIYSGRKYPTGYIYNCSKNCLGLLKGKSIRIKSKNTELRDLFYDVFTKINDEWKFGCSFDFDQYDYEFDIREYILPEGKNLLITILSGEDFPNKSTALLMKTQDVKRVE